MTEISQELPEGVKLWRSSGWACMVPVDLSSRSRHPDAYIKSRDLPAIQAQVLAGVKGVLALVPYNAKEDIAQGVNPDVAIEDAINAALATLNPNEGEGEDCNCESCSFSRLGPKGKG